MRNASTRATHLRGLPPAAAGISDVVHAAAERYGFDTTLDPPASRS